MWDLFYKVLDWSNIYFLKEEMKKTTYRAKKSTEITDIKDVLYEVENINIKGCIFGIDYFESKSGYKIITLKVTDNTDSMYVKMFTKDDEEYSLIKKLLKEGKWYIFYGKAAMDKYANEIVFTTRYKDVEETEINASGPAISEQELGELFKKLDKEQTSKKRKA